jgi:hypothetical protein
MTSPNPLGLLLFLLLLKKLIDVLLEAKHRVHRTPLLVVNQVEQGRIKRVADNHYKVGVPNVPTGSTLCSRQKSLSSRSKVRSVTL